MRAIQIYAILIGAAHSRQTITYGMLAKQLGYKGAGVFAQTLDYLSRWCGDNELPRLPALVVGLERGTPGVGFVAPVNLDTERERVFAHDWYDIVPPTVEELEALY